MRFASQILSGQHFTSSFSVSLPAAVPTRLLMAHHSPPALGTYTGCGWSILYSGHVGVEDRTLETVGVDM